MADIFEIVGKFAIDGADKAKKEINDVTSTGEKSSSALGKFGKLVGAVGKGVLAVGGAVSAGSVALVKSVQSSYGELEQNLGGSKAVYGQYASDIQKIAQDAYKNMGMSQSEYLATANKMGSLLQGSGIEQKEALDMTTKAMQRASDVASVMGIDMSMAMESIAGACKGNFTMMDNLGVAMNATTLEAYAHSKGIENFTWKTATQAEKNALAMQMFLERTEQYAGNFARESTDTITGSIGYLSAAWDDFKAGLGNPTADMARLTNNLALSFGAMVNNMTPIIENIANALPTVMTSLIDAVGTMLPTLIETFTTVVTQVINSIVALLPSLIPLVVDALMSIVEALINSLPQLLDSVILLISETINSLAEMLPTLIPLIVKVVLDMANSLVENMPMLLDAVLQLIQGLMQGLIEALPVLIEALPTLITAIVDFLITATPQLMEAGITLMMALVDALPVIIDALVVALPQIVQAIADGLIRYMPLIISAGIQLQMALIKAILLALGELVKSLPKIISAVMQSLGNLLKSIGTFSANLLSKVGSFFSNLIRTGVTKTGEFVNNVINAIKQLPTQIAYWLGVAVGKIASLLVSAVSKAVQFARDFPEKARQAGSNFVNTLVNFIRTLPSKIASFLQNVIAKVASFASTFKQKALEAGQGFATTLINALKAIPGQMASIGRSIVDGIWGGISSAWSGLTSKVSSLKTNLVQGFKSAFNINSPSRVMRDEVGISIGEGIGDGILRSYDKIKGVVNTWCGKVINGFKNALGIHSPARVTRDDVGKPLVEGIAVGIKENSGEVSEEFQRMLNDLKLKRDLDVINDAEYYAELEKLRNNYLKKGTSDWWQYTKDIIDYEKELSDQEKELIDETTEYLTSSYEEHIKKREDLTSGFLQEISKTKLYELKKVRGVKLGVEYEYEAPKLKDWDFELEQLDKFESRILDVQNRLTSVFSGDDEALQSMLNTIRKDPFGEGGKVLYAMFESTQEELEKFANGYREYIEKTNSVTRNVYSDDLKKLDQNFVSDIINTFRNNPEIEKIKTFGQNIVEKIVDGIKSKGGWLKEQLDDLCDIIANNLVFDMAFTDGKVELVNSRLANNLQPSQIETNNNTNAINENIDRLISLIGEYLPGIADKMDRPITVDGDSLAVGMTRKIDSQLGKLTIAKGRGNV